MGNYFIVGGSLLQLDFIRKVKDNGYTAHVVDFDPECVGAKEGDYFHCVSIDDREKVLSLAKKYDAVAVHTVATEQGNVTSSYVSEKLGLFGNSFEVALNTTDKKRMKAVLNAHDIATPTSRPVRSKEELKNLDISFPVVVKASDRSAGRGVCLAENLDELLIAFDDALSESFSKVVLIEDYFIGQQYSVETVSVSGKHDIVAITKMGFTGPPDFVETEHVIPAPISKELQSLITNFVNCSLNAFDISYGACHLELRIDCNNNIKMIEIASRMGGWRHWMIESALGIDYLQLILNSSIGKSVEVKRKHFDLVSVVRNIVDLNGYSNYLSSLERNESIVVDHVKSGAPQSNASNLINSHGFYVTVNKDKR